MFDPNETTDTTAAEPVDAAAEAMAAMDAGIAAATEAEPAPEAPPIEAEAEAPVPGSPEALAAEQAAADAAKAKPEGEGETPPEAVKPEPDAETEKEIAGLNLKDKAAERFRDMAGQIKTLAPLKAALETAGIKDVADIPKLVANAKDGADMVEMVSGTGATPDQFGMTLDYLTLVSKAGQGDRAAAEQAFELVGKEYLSLAKVLNKEVQGIHDPLTEHPDLREEIEAGDITRKRALEIAEQRATKKLQDDARAAADARTQQEAASTTAQQQALTAARNDLNVLDQELAADPQYAQKRALLVAKLPEITAQFPPGQWKAAAKLAYQAIQLTPAPAAKVPVGPIRPGGPRPVIVPAVFDDPDAAMEAGIAAASL